MNDLRSQLKSIVWKYVNARQGYSSGSSESLYELMKHLYTNHSGNDADVLVILEKYEYDKEILSAEDESMLSCNYAEAVDIMCFPRDFGYSPEMVTGHPEDIMKLIPYFISFSDGEEVYNPFAGYNSYAMILQGCQVIGNEEKPLAWAVGQIRLHSKGIRADVRNENFFEMNPDAKYDNIICTIPFEINDQKGFDAIAGQLYNQLKDNGLLAMIIKSRFLSLGDGTSVMDTLVRDKAIAGIVSLPENMENWEHSGTELLIIEKKKHDGISMYDATMMYTRKDSKNPQTFDFDDFVDEVEYEGSYKMVAYATIEHSGILSPVCMEYHSFCDYINLTELVEFEENGNMASYGKFSSYYISMGDLNKRLPVKPLEAFTQKHRMVCGGIRLSRPAVIVGYDNVYITAFDTPTIKVGYSETGDVCIGKGLIAMYPKAGVSKDYLMALFLSESSFLYQLQMIYRSGHNVQCGEEFLKRILVPHHTEEQKKQMVDNAIRNSLYYAENEIRNKHNEYIREMRIRKHALAQNISALSSRWSALNKFRQRNGGNLSDKDLIGRQNPTSVSEMFDAINHSIKVLEDRVEHLTDIADNPSGTVVKLNEMIDDYVKRHSDNRFTFVKKADVKNNLFVYFSNESFEQVMDNIVSNATSHGFNDTSRNDYRIILDWQDEGDTVVMLISNNGIPIGGDVRTDMLLSYGYSSALNKDGHSGIGGYDIKRIMENYDGSSDVISSPAEEYPVKYRLVFRMVNHNS